MSTATGHGFDVDREVETLRALAWQEHKQPHHGRPSRLREKQPLRRFFRLLVSGVPRFKAAVRAGYSDETVYEWMQAGRDGVGPVYVRFRQAVHEAQAIGRQVGAARKASRRAAQQARIAERAASRPPGRSLAWRPLLPHQVQNSIPGTTLPADGAYNATIGETVSEGAPAPVLDCVLVVPEPSACSAEGVAADAARRGEETSRAEAAARKERIQQLSIRLFELSDRFQCPLSDGERVAISQDVNRTRAELDALLRAAAPATETLEERRQRYLRWRELTRRANFSDREAQMVRERGYRESGFDR